MRSDYERAMRAARQMTALYLSMIRRAAHLDLIDGNDFRRQGAAYDGGAIDALCVLLDLHGTEDDKLLAQSSKNESRFLRFKYGRA